MAKKRPKTHRDDPILTQKEAAAQLGVSSDTVRRWLKNRELRGQYRPPGYYGVRQSEVDRWLQENVVAEKENGQ